MRTVGRPVCLRAAARGHVRAPGVAGVAPRPTSWFSHDAQQQTGFRQNCKSYSGKGGNGDSGPHQPSFEGSDGHGWNGSTSKVFGSEVVMKEFNEFLPQMMQLASMSNKFPEFDLEGKKMYLAQMQEMVGRHEVFMKRFELSDHPNDKEYLRTMNAQMLNAGGSIRMMFEGAKQRNMEYSRWVEEEEAVSADPVKHQQFLQMFKEKWRKSALGSINMGHISALIDTNPQVLTKAQTDPQFFLAMKEICKSPTPEVMGRWADHPGIGPYVREMMRTMHE